MKTIIPLFPLSMVVLPGQTVQLHIFEEHYRQMIADCLAPELQVNDDSSHGREFGVNYATDNGLAAIGCTLSVVKILKRFRDGRIDLLAEGRRRFRLTEIVDGKSYQQGSVRYVRDRRKDNFTSSNKGDFLNLHKEMCVVAGIKSTLKLSHPMISYRSACAIGLDDFQRQTLLELASEHDRLLWLADLYKAILSHIKTGKNGFYNGVPGNASLLLAEPDLQIH